MKRCASKRIGLLACFGSLIAAIGLTSSAQATIVGTMTLMRDPTIGVPFTSPDDALPAPWVSYLLGLQGTIEVIGAVDLTVQHSQLHQRWVDLDLDGVWEPTANASHMVGGDTHLRTATGAIFGAGPIEDNTGIGSPLADSMINDYGLGTTLSGAWAIPGASQSERTSLAYVVIPKGTEQLLDIRVGVADALASTILYLTEQDFIQTFATGRVTGNGLVIDRGDTTPREEDGTDFGLGLIGATQRSTFMIENTGAEPLSLGSPTFTGPFVLEGSDFPSTILPGASASFNVLLHRDTPGNLLGSISFGSNSGQYTFALAGQAVPEPTAIVVAGLALVAFAGCRRWR